MCDKVAKKSQTEYKIKYKLLESMLQQRIKIYNSIHEEWTVKNSTRKVYMKYTICFFSCLKNYFNPFSEFFLMCGVH